MCIFVNPDKGFTQCNQQMNGQGHYFLPRKNHGRYFPHQQQLQPETFAYNDLDIMHWKPISETRENSSSENSWITNISTTPKLFKKFSDYSK